MKEILTSPVQAAKWILGKGVLALVFSTLFCAAAFGQKSSSDLGIGDISSTNWKAQSALEASIAQEKSKTDLVLASPDLPQTDRALFLSYQRLLDYLNTDLQSGKPVHEAIEGEYKKVVEEVLADPVLKNMSPDGLRALLPGLIEALTELPQAAPLNQW